MTKFIVSAYSALLDTMLVVFLGVGAILAYSTIPDSIFSSSLYGLKDVIKIVIGVAGTFVLEVLFIGPFLVLEDIRQTVRTIERRLVNQTKTNNSNTEPEIFECDIPIERDANSININQQVDYTDNFMNKFTKK
jgi:hypothetical protein